MPRISKLIDQRKNLIYIGYFELAIDMPTLAKMFGISKQMIHKVLSEVSAKRQLKVKQPLKK